MELTSYRRATAIAILIVGGIILAGTLLDELNVIRAETRAAAELARRQAEIAVNAAMVASSLNAEAEIVE